MKNLLRSGILTLGLISGANAATANPLELESTYLLDQSHSRDPSPVRRHARHTERDTDTAAPRTRRDKQRTLALKRLTPELEP